MRRAEGGAKMFGVFRVKNHDFTPKNLICSDCGGRRENVWGISCGKSRFYAKKSYFFRLQREARKFLRYLVWKITILRQQIIFFPILGGGGARAGGATPPPRFGPWFVSISSHIYIWSCKSYKKLCSNTSDRNFPNISKK